MSKWHEYRGNDWADLYPPKAEDFRPHAVGLSVHIDWNTSLAWADCLSIHRPLSKESQKIL